MSLRELTQDLHSIAERTPIAKLLATGRVTKEQYRTYLYQLIAIYGPIEFSTKLQGQFLPLANEPRLPKVFKDYLELVDGEANDVWIPETVAYSNYLLELINDPARKHLIRAHAYVRIMGDLSGGQLLAQVCPGSCEQFRFSRPCAEIKAELYPELTDDLGDEARVAFQYFIDIMHALGGTE